MVRNICRQIYGGLKLSKEKLRGSEIFSLKCMGVPNFLWSKYGGLNFFREKIWGSEIFPGENSGSIGTFMFVVSPTEFCFSVLILFSFFDFFCLKSEANERSKMAILAKLWANFGRKFCFINVHSSGDLDFLRIHSTDSGIFRTFIRYRVCYIYLWQLILYIHIVDTMYIPDMKYIFIYCVNHSFCCPLKFLVS